MTETAWDRLAKRLNEKEKRAGGGNPYHDKLGKFTTGPGGPIKLPTKPISLNPSGPVKMDQSPQAIVKSVEDALANGREVTVTQDQFTALISDMGPPPPPPPLNLGKLAVEGNPNCFAHHAREIPRANMPQLPGTSDELQAFSDALAREGISASIEKIDPRMMHMTQNQLDSQKVAKLAQIMYEKGWKEDSILFVSQDMDILDGHHRWAGASAAAMMGKPVKVTAFKANTDIDTLLRIAETVSGPHKEAPRSYTRRKGDGMKFGENPTGPPPDKNKPYVWFNGKWYLVVTDTEDGVPESLDYLNEKKG